MRIGVLGGTFDPIHYGHLILAEMCREANQLDRILFVPAGQPPHKQHRQVTQAAHRKEMVNLAVAGHPQFCLSTIELDRAGPSYTADTLAELARDNPGSRLFFLLGSDTVEELATWHRPDQVAALATLVVGTRPGSAALNLEPLRTALPGQAIEQLRAHTIELPAIHISSRDIRERVASGRTIRYLVPRPVECYIQEHGLYKAPKITSD